MTGRVLATAVTQAGICGSLGWSPGFAAAGNTAQDYYTFASAVIRYFTIYSCWKGEGGGGGIINLKSSISHLTRTIVNLEAYILKVNKTAGVYLSAQKFKL